MSSTEPVAYVVPAELEGERVDKIVAALAGLSRSAVGRLVDSGHVTIAGSPVRSSERLDVGVVVEVVHDPGPTEVVAADIDFGVAYQDDEVVVVDKPPGLVVHPGSGHHDDTLLNGLLHRFPELRALGEERRYGLLHRLDRDTSGLLLVARTGDVYDDLRSKLAAREITRRYLTLVLGAAPAATGTVDAPIARDPASPTRNMVRTGGRPATTHYRRLAAWDDVSLLLVTLETGRTHQIRVHLGAIDLLVVGDRVYGRVDPRYDPGRTFLHAAHLGFTTLSGLRHDIRSGLPPDLAGVLAALGEPTVGRWDPEAPLPA